MKTENLNNLLIFIHIQKTAGQTFRAILNEKYGSDKCLEVGKSAHHVSIEQLKKMSRDERNKFSCLSAHLPYGLHSYFDKPYSYITFLREPIERAVSQFFYLRRTPTNERYSQIKETGFSFLSYTENDEFGRPDNMQIRYIINDFIKDKIDIDDYKLSKVALMENFTMFGITERFEESIKKIETLFKWNKTIYIKKNVTKERPASTSLHPRAISLLKDKNYYDMLLYEFALKQFEIRIAH